MRVIIEAKFFSASSPFATPSRREIKLAGRLFATTNDAAPELQKLAKNEILNGNSAAVIAPQLLRPEAIFFDMDATVIAEESLVEISKLAGKQKEVQDLTEKAMAGGMDFEESLRQRVAILAGLHRDQIHSIQPTINPGFQTLVEWCHGLKIPIFLVSGGFVDLAEPLATSFGFRDFKANHFAWKDDRLAGLAEGEIVDAKGKCEAIMQWCSIYNLNPTQCIAVGDGANDLHMMNLCGLAVGYSPKKNLWPHLDVANHTGDHRFLLACLGP
jgi:phosphoserine phosphatase